MWKPAYAPDKRSRYIHEDNFEYMKMHIELDSNLLFLNLNDKSLPIFRVYLGVTTWQDFLLKRNKVSFSGSKNLTKSQAPVSVTEAWMFSHVFRTVNATWQNIPVDRRKLVSVVAILPPWSWQRKMTLSRDESERPLKFTVRPQQW